MKLQSVPCTLDVFIQFKAGKESAFRTLFEYYYPILYRKICKFCPNVVEAEEITQEVFVQLFLKRGEIKNITSIYPFLYTVAKRMAVSYFRKRIVRLRYQQEELQQWSESCFQTQEKIELKELQTLVDNVIEDLPVQQQQVYRMNKLEEKSYDEIAKELGLSKHTVRNHLYLATKFVRISMEKILFIIFLLKI